ncbi:TetR/AcrR family transcriptional regulator [Ferrovibrio sp.]|uniref:TetR/AcrR family transcriptional regulator n=1 Tax=Ferrovibrio sp. TaxID=1917215 RepID=UPI001B45A5B9|nr:TetR/AcrR family transcriptional regulator [Ferrovibrio sp.]MBP7065814.1 TetR family transcriptional regulator [Ferrovibrio sp.]
MARPQAADYADKREAILDMAAELFARRGFAGASLADLAEASGYSKSSLYHYFGDKQAILYQAMQAHLAELTAIADTAMDVALPPEQQLRRFARATMRAYATARWKHRLLVNETASLAPAERRQVVAAQRALVQRVADLLERLRPSANVAERWPNAMLFYGMLNFTYTWYDPAGAVTPEALADQAVSIFLNGFGTKKTAAE